jgi:hypothetical protein
MGKACIACKLRKSACLLPGEERNRAQRGKKAAPEVKKVVQEERKPKTELRKEWDVGVTMRQWVSVAEREKKEKEREMEPSRPSPVREPEPENARFAGFLVDGLQAYYGGQTDHDKQVLCKDMLSFLMVRKFVENALMDDMIEAVKKEIEGLRTVENWVETVEGFDSNNATEVRKGLRSSVMGPTATGELTGTYSEFVQGSSGSPRVNLGKWVRGKDFNWSPLGSKKARLENPEEEYRGREEGEDDEEEGSEEGSE